MVWNNRKEITTKINTSNKDHFVTRTSGTECGANDIFMIKTFSKMWRTRTLGQIPSISTDNPCEIGFDIFL